MKRNIRSTQSVSRPAPLCVMAVDNAVRFFIAQLFLGIFGFWFTLMPI